MLMYLDLVEINVIQCINIKLKLIKAMFFFLLVFYFYFLPALGNCEVYLRFIHAAIYGLLYLCRNNAVMNVI